MTLSQISDHELQAELERRQQPKPAKPTAKENPDFRGLIELCEDYVNDIDSGKTGEDSDYDGYIYESALEAVFGSEIFDWIKQRTR